MNALARGRATQGRRLPARQVAAVACLLAATACRDTRLGFASSFVSNSVSVRAGPPDGAYLRFVVPERGIGVPDRPIRFRPEQAVLHLHGYVPLVPDSLTEVPGGVEVHMTLPPDAMKLTEPWFPQQVTLRGELYLPGEVEPQDGPQDSPGATDGMRVLGVRLDAAYDGPTTRALLAIREFLRGFYSAN